MKGKGWEAWRREVGEEKEEQIEYWMQVQIFVLVHEEAKEDGLLPPFRYCCESCGYPYLHSEGCLTGCAKRCWMEGTKQKDQAIKIGS